jgi:hypothetical protein
MLRFAHENLTRPAIVLLLLGFFACATPLICAQAPASDPVLHRRSYNHDDADMEYDTRSTGRTILPLEASGEYSMGSGGMVDVELQPDRLSGFITRSGDRESDEGTPLTFFFATSRLAGQQLAFNTRQVHGAGAHGVVASRPAKPKRLKIRCRRSQQPVAGINTMGRAIYPNSPQEEFFVWIVQQAQCGTAA